jgi:hypothetical protein
MKRVKLEINPATLKLVGVPKQQPKPSAAAAVIRPVPKKQ